MHVSGFLETAVGNGDEKISTPTYSSEKIRYDVVTAVYIHVCILYMYRLCVCVCVCTSRIAHTDTHVC